MSKSRSFLSILVPSATVFFSSACIMILELVAGRLIARYLGSSLYTWTSVIGVVLAGITIGNYLGGRIADRFPAKKSLSVLFGICSIACVVTIVLNNLVGEWIWLWQFGWPVRVFTHVAIVFLLPSTLLGTISPVVAKMALDQGLPIGRTVGDIYAWGAAGSIAGTFLAGFYLIAAMGTIAIIWTVGAALLLMGILYWARFWALYIWAMIFIALMITGTASKAWAQNAGSSMGLRQEYDPSVLYEDETQYCYIAVKQLSQNSDTRLFMQDKLKHSEIVMEDINNLRYFYTHIYASITHELSQNREKLSVMHIGGGGYVFPQYIEKNWPGSRNDVVEIDPGVTEAAIQAFGLSRDTTINTITMDARNYVDELLENERNGKEIPRYDFVYEDAFNDYSVPYQLVTKEFNDKIAQILTNDGVYIVNLIDVFDNGQFLGSFINTLEQTFPNVYVLSGVTPYSARNTFVIVAAKQQVDLENILGKSTRGVEIWYLNDTEINTLKQKSQGVILTDDYVPVENMLAPVVRQSAVDILSGKIREQAEELKSQNRFDEATIKYKKLIEIDPTRTILAFNEIAMMAVRQDRLNEGAKAFHKAIDYNEQLEFKTNIASIYLSLGLVLNKLKQPEEAKNYIHKAIKGFKEELITKPKSLKTIIRLGNALAEIGDFNQASKYFQQAVDLDPYDISNHYTLSKTFEFQEKYDEAIAVLKKAKGVMTHIGRKEDAEKLQEGIEFFEYKKSKQNK